MNDNFNMPTPSGVYAITPDVSARWSSSAILECTEAILEQGVKWVQLRQKKLLAQCADVRSLTDEYLMLAEGFGEMCARHQAHLVLNDIQPAMLAQLSLATVWGVHLGRDDGRLDVAKEQLPLNCGIGASCYDDVQRAKVAVSHGAHYIAFGAMYPSRTKPLAKTCSLEVLRQGSLLGVPVVAIGGITLLKVPELLKAGAQAVAVLGALYDGDNEGDNDGGDHVGDDERHLNVTQPNAEAVAKRAAQWVEETTQWNEHDTNRRDKNKPNTMRPQC